MSTEASQDQKPVEAPPKATKSNGGKKKKDNPKGFNPGGSAPIIPISHQAIPGVTHSFLVTTDSIDNVCDQLSLEAEARSFDSGGAVAPAVIQDSVRRLGRFCFAKKLVYASDDRYAGVLRSDLAPIVQSILDVPDPIKVAVEGVGKFTLNSANFVPFATPLSAFNVAVHALGTPNQDGLPVAYNRDAVFVSSNMTSWKAMGRDHFRDIYNAWTGKGVEINLGNVRVEAPIIRGNYGVMAAALQGQANVPPEIINALLVCEAFNAGINDPAFPDQAATQVLNNANVYVLGGWTKTFMQQKVIDFKKTHVHYINRWLGRTFTMHKDVKTFEANGKPWQIVNVENDVASAPVGIDPTDAELAMCFSNATSVLITKQAVEWHTAMPADSRASRFVLSMSKNE